MRLLRVRLTVRCTMIAVAIVALLLAFALDIHMGVNKFVRLESSLGPRTRDHARLPLVVLLTAAVAAPLLGAAALVAKTARDVRGNRYVAYRLIAASALVAITVGVAVYPVDGLRFSQRLRDGTAVGYLYRYRLWPGRHTEFCLEVVGPLGRRRYLISGSDRYFAPTFYTDSGQSLVWLVDNPYPGHRSDGVLCSLDLATGRFVGPSGPHPAVVTETSGIRIVPPARATRKTPAPSAAPGGPSANQNDRNL